MSSNCRWCSGTHIGDQNCVCIMDCGKGWCPAGVSLEYCVL